LVAIGQETHADFEYVGHDFLVIEPQFEVFLTNALVFVLHEVVKANHALETQLEITAVLKTHGGVFAEENGENLL